MAADNIDVGASENEVAGGDICMEEAGVAKDDMVSERDVAN